MCVCSKLLTLKRRWPSAEIYNNKGITDSLFEMMESVQKKEVKKKCEKYKDKGYKNNKATGSIKPGSD